MNQWVEEKTCRCCGKTELVPILDLGAMPPANAFLREEDLEKIEPSFPLRLAICPGCILVQLQDTVDPQTLFSREYYYLTGANIPLVKHFESFGERLAKEFRLTKKDLVVEMGSNDGVLLSSLLPYSRVLGVDPALNVSREAEKRGVPTMQDFFGEAAADSILEKEGPAKLILGNNVFAHIGDSHDVLRGISKLLTPEGRFIAEVHWVGNLVGDGGFDQIYHEHIYYYSLHALKNLIEQVPGLTLDHVELLPIHGQSLRIFVSKEKRVNESIDLFMETEKSLGLHEVDTYSTFSKKVENNKNSLTTLLRKLKNDGKKIIGYGAAGKGNTLLNYFNIGPEILDYITDTTPTKQGSYTPGTHIRVVSPEILNRETPDYILLLSWNYANSILEKERELRSKGAKFIIPIPEVKIV